MWKIKRSTWTLAGGLVRAIRVLGMGGIFTKHLTQEQLIAIAASPATTAWMGEWSLYRSLWSALL